MDVKHAGPTAVTIFGAGGDLARRKLVPALLNLMLDGWLADEFVIIGMDRSDMSQKAFRERMQSGIEEFSRQSVTDERWDAFAKKIHYIKADLTDAKAYETLAKKVEALTADWEGPVSKLFYMSVPPFLIEDVSRGLADAGLTDDPAHDRLIIEKPFGHNLESAQSLNALLKKHFEEKQIFRIDHFLGKETVQNILAFRFGNTLFEPIWNRNYIDQVQITVAEELGIGHRGSYYDRAGALRDMVQNHLMQILCLTAMESPVSFHADEIRNKMLEVMQAIRPLDGEVIQSAARGQYKGYRDEPEVDDDSMTETYVAVKFYIDNWRWQGVPFYLRTGKQMAEKATLVNLQFQPVPHRAFPAAATPSWAPNELHIHLAPNEGIDIVMQAKEPGPELKLKPVNMHFLYREAFEHEPMPDAYETLLLDVMQGDSTLFMRADQVEEAWRVVMPILEAWAEGSGSLAQYERGTWGPQAADMLLARDGHIWLGGEYLT